MKKRTRSKETQTIYKENGFEIVFYRCLFIFFRTPKRIYQKTRATTTTSTTIFHSEKKKSGKKIRLLNPNDNLTTLIFLCIHINVYMCIEYGIYGSDYLPQIIHKHLRLPIEQQQQRQQHQQNHMIFKSINQCM